MIFIFLLDKGRCFLPLAAYSWTTFWVLIMKYVICSIDNVGNPVVLAKHIKTHNCNFAHLEVCDLIKVCTISTEC